MRTEIGCLGTFTQYIDSGFGLLGGEVAFIATTLIVIDTDPMPGTGAGGAPRVAAIEVAIPPPS